ncbi:MAG TPA: FGGY-family carbohydrate kinase [Acidimicrobiia bacterium]|nr:FGGY-family carbohydrate kinase [Acidimicrobiia bacterium]
MSLLVADIGTSSVRGAVVRADATVGCEHRHANLPDSPAPGLVEFDAAAMAAAVLETTRAALAEAGPGSVDALGIANQRGSAVVWDRATGEPVAPGIGWQDLRTLGRCLELRGTGFRFAPNMAATKFEAILDAADPDRTRDLCLGTVDSWITWVLSEGTVHVTDLSNAGISGLIAIDGSSWDTDALTALRIAPESLPELVDTTGVVGEARALDGAPVLAARVGDQQASLVGQGCVRPGSAKITFGTGGMLDVCLGPDRPGFATRGDAGTFPIVAWRAAGRDTWGIEAIMLSAGTNVEWLRDDLGLLASAAESHDVAQQCTDSGGVWYVPALLGLGTPQWDYGARGTVLGLTRGSGRAEIVRAVLEGVAHRGADLVEAAEADAGLTIPALRVDGGMTANPTFTQALADAAQKPVEISPVEEATALGAGFLAGLAVGTWAGEDDLASTWEPRARVDPGDALDRDRWREAVRRAEGWLGDLSAIDF